MTTAHAALAFTAQELRRLEGEGAVEFADGQVVEKPVSVESSEVEARIIILLGAEAMRSRSARVYPSSMGYRCYADDPSKFRKPDVSVVREDRLVGVEPTEGFMPIPADLVVEVISPNDLYSDVATKVEEYLQNGFGFIWVVDPPTRTVEIHRADGSLALLRQADEIVGENALPTFKCRVAEFFAPDSHGES